MLCYSYHRFLPLPSIDSKQKLVAHCYQKIFAFPDCFCPSLFQKGFSRATAHSQQKAAGGDWHRGLRSPPSKSNPDWAQPDAALPCSIQHLLHPLTSPVEKMMFQQHGLKEMGPLLHHFKWLPLFSSPEDTVPTPSIRCTLNMLLWEPALLTTHCTSFLPDPLSPCFIPKQHRWSFHSCWCCSFIQ